MSRDPLLVPVVVAAEPAEDDELSRKMTAVLELVSRMADDPDVTEGELRNALRETVRMLDAHSRGRLALRRRWQWTGRMMLGLMVAWVLLVFVQLATALRWL